MGMFIPFANTIGALVGGVTSVILMLWIAIGGNFSRLTGKIVYETKTVSVGGCPSGWNVTSDGNPQKYMDGLEW